MKQTPDIFGMAFLDLISCGLGAVIVLMLIFSSLMNANGSVQKQEGMKEANDTSAPAKTSIEFYFRISYPKGENSHSPLEISGLPENVSKNMRKVYIEGNDQRSLLFFYEPKSSPSLGKKIAFSIKGLPAIKYINGLPTEAVCGYSFAADMALVLPPINIDKIRKVKCTNLKELFFTYRVNTWTVSL